MYVKKTIIAPENVREIKKMKSLGRASKVSLYKTWVVCKSSWSVIFLNKNLIWKLTYGSCRGWVEILTEISRLLTTVDDLDNWQADEK